jgi:hypothetical protein
VEVGKINFLRDICDLTIYYYSNKMNEGHASDQKQKTDNDGDDD